MSDCTKCEFMRRSDRLARCPEHEDEGETASAIWQRLFKKEAQCKS